jgi:hypothetical protein
MSEFYKANDKILSIEFQGSYFPIACATSNTFEESSDSINTTTRDNGGFKTSRPTNQEYSIPFQGVETQLDIIAGKITYKDLQNFKKNRTLVSFRLGTQKIIEGRGYIFELSSESPVNDLVSFSGVLTGFGAYSDYDPSTNSFFNYELNFNL